MLIILIVWIYATFLLWSFGVAYQRIIEKIFSEQKDISPYLTLWNGILFITVILSIISIFSKITYELSLVFFACSVLYIIFDFSYVKDKFKSIIQRLKGISPFVYVVFTLFFIATLFQSSLPGTIYNDTLIYHHQTVKWINNYSVVPGLGNLFPQLAFNSHWLLFSALLNYNDYDFHFMNGLIVIFGFFWVLTGLNELLQKRFSLIKIIKGLTILFVALKIFAIRSLSTDFPTAFIIYFILFYAVELLEKKEDNKVLIFMLLNFSFFVVTIKLSSLFIVIAPLYFLYLFLKRSNIKLKSISFVAVSFIIIIMPFLIRNIILSGYLVFPFPMLDFFDFDWKVSYNIVILEKNAIEFWAKMPLANWPSVANNDFWFWFVPWIKRNLLFIGNKEKWEAIELVLFFISVIAYIFYSFFNFNKVINHLKKFSIIYLTLLVNISVWFITAPAIRFASGYLFFSIVFLIALQEWKWIVKAKENINIIKLAKVLLIILSVGSIFFRPVAVIEMTFTNPKKWLTYVITPAPYPERKLISKKLSDKVILYMSPDSGQCSNAPLPCVEYPRHFNNPKLEMRGKSLQDGFRIADNK